MKKLNNKGFAISGVVYSLLLLFVILLYAILSILANRKIILDKTKKDMLLEINGEAESEEGTSGPTVADYVFSSLAAQYDGVQSFRNNKWQDLTGLGNDGSIRGFEDGGGKKTNYIYFDGKHDSIEIPRTIGYSFSIEIVFSTIKGIGTSTKWYQAAGLVDADVSGVTNDFGISINKNGAILAGVGNSTGSEYLIYSRNGFNNGNIQTVSFVRNGAAQKLELYTNGSKEKEVNGSSNTLSAPTKISIGKILSTNNYFNGNIYSIRIYSKPLSATEIANNYKVDKARYFLQDPPNPAPLS